ncbi:aldolase/citrate lyase family protein [Melioribacteraceae bacterium 4301-Me]|uniref:aldolase/citrate lyase family protein n=1 Tax=Pyranulibacter aquaticus TaxID=3163344 RepID=UPI0035975EF1
MVKTKTKVNPEIGMSGKRGEKVRSDCHIEIELTKRNGVIIELNSKVNTLYGEVIKDLILQVCSFFEIKNAKIKIEDSGALPFTLAARFEAAYKQINFDDNREFLLPFNRKNYYKTQKDRLRRSRLYLPGKEPKFFPNAGLHKPDGIILDLEDSVAPSEKLAARYLVRNALRSVDFYGAERMVRINQLPMGLEDLRFVVPHNVHVILIPKCESADTVKQVEEEINIIRAEKNFSSEIYFMPIIESAAGVLKAYEIATASDNVCALTIGLEDYTADIGVERTNDGKESFYARSAIITAAKAAGVQAIDSVFSDVDDFEGLRKSVIEAKSLGFEGKGCIHPRQIKVVHEAFAPTEKEIEKAKKIVVAFKEAEKKKLGVVSLGSKMVDAPVVKRAQKIIDLALMYNLLEKNWEEKLQ